MILKQTLGAPGALALVCAMGAVGSARGDVLYDNFGAGNSYQATSGYGFGGSAPNFGQAMAFTANNSYLLTGGDFGVSLSSGLNPSTFQITVHADESGLPGAVLEQVTVMSQLGPFGLQNPPVVVNFLGTTLLNAGDQYWISMSAGAFTSAVWNGNNTGDVGPRAFRLNGGPWTLATTGARGAFRLNGTLVPSPGAIGLLGLFACAARGRRRVL